ncbi:hypothetical protein P4631_09155 [Halalkalibacterium halodurans]|uniref:hypothetical protein n=1 Tax=Halalkalibacterium halodurans TaxID=86665 RepID=UPI002E238DF2|nr:hypothetical protein [Halalkalibacterium halodurans]
MFKKSVKFFVDLVYVAVFFSLISLVISAIVSIFTTVNIPMAVAASALAGLILHVLAVIRKWVEEDNG